MLMEITMYYVRCDGCKKTYTNPIDENTFIDQSEAAEKITENGWVIDGEKCYCPDCK